MNMNRRKFIGNVGAGALGLLAATTLRGAGKTAGKTPPPAPAWDPQDADGFWRAVRAQFPLKDDPAYLNTGGLGAAPSVVLYAATDLIHELQQHSETGHDLFGPARATLAAFLGAAPEEICFTRNTTEGNGLVAGGLATMRTGDEVIFCSHAHVGGSFPWMNRQKLHGIKVRTFDPDPASPEGNLERIRALLTPRTRAIQVSHLTCTTGLRFPVGAIARLAHEHGCWFHIDAAQSAGMIPIDVKAIGCDSLAFSGHKWLGAPHETGVLYVTREKLDQVPPIEVGAYTNGQFRLPDLFTYNPTAQRYEYGTRSAAAVVAQARAADFQTAIGRERIAAYGAGLTTYLLGRLGEIKGVEPLTPSRPDMRGSITTVRLPGIDCVKLFDFLWSKHHLRCRLVTEQNLNALRVSTHIYNSRDECDRVVAGIADARKTL